MFDPNDKSYAAGPVFSGKKTKGPGDAWDGARHVLKLTGDEAKKNPLDTEKAQELHSRLMGWYSHELDRQSDNRAQMAMDEDFYDHMQWSEAELAELKSRGQAPIVFNVTQTTINWVLGTQRRTPQDYRILPRRKEGAPAAQRKTELLKHVADENRSEYEVAAAFSQAVKAGLGWLECGQGRQEEGTQVYDRHEDWRNMLWDSTSRRYDLIDARYLYRTKWLDTDVAESLWPPRKGLISTAASSYVLGATSTDNLGDEAMDFRESEYFNTASGRAGNRRYSDIRERIRVIEAWFKMPVKDALIMRGGQFNGELFDEWSQGHWKDVKDGRATVVARTDLSIIHVALMTDSGLLDLRPSPYRHNRYPFTPVWGYRRASDGMPYGMIRGIRDIQRDLNKRASKALHHLSTTRVTVETGAVADIEVLRDEAARPDAVIEYEQGHPAPDVHTDTNLASAHIELMSRDAEMIQAIAGVTDENLGRRTNATSGIAIQRRQDQGSLATSMFFENLRQSRQIHGEKQVVLVEMYYDKSEEFRITDARGNPSFMPINDGKPENAIAEFKADFVITEEDWRASARQAKSEMLMNFTSQLAATAPQIVISILDLVIEGMDLPKGEEIVKRVRGISGVDDPDADPNNPDPETKAKQAAAAEAQDMEKRAAIAALKEQEGKARKIAAEAAKAEGGLQTDQIARLQAAMEAAIQIAGAPAVAAAADRVLAEAQAAAVQQASAGEAAAQPPMQPQADPMNPMPANPATM